MVNNAVTLIYFGALLHYVVMVEDLQVIPTIFPHASVLSPLKYF